MLIFHTVFFISLKPIANLFFLYKQDDVWIPINETLDIDQICKNGDRREYRYVDRLKPILTDIFKKDNFSLYLWYESVYVSYITLYFIFKTMHIGKVLLSKISYK